MNKHQISLQIELFSQRERVLSSRCCPFTLRLPHVGHEGRGQGFSVALKADATQFLRTLIPLRGALCRGAFTCRVGVASGIYVAYFLARRKNKSLRHVRNAVAVCAGVCACVCVFYDFAVRRAYQCVGYANDLLRGPFTN